MRTIGWVIKERTDEDRKPMYYAAGPSWFSWSTERKDAQVFDSVWSVHFAFETKCLDPRDHAILRITKRKS